MSTSTASVQVPVLTIVNLKGFDEEEIRFITELINHHEMSPGGISAFIEFLNVRRDHYKSSVQELKRLLEVLVNNHWQDQNSEHRGDPNAPDDDGSINRGIWELMYDQSHLPVPKKFENKF